MFVFIIIYNLIFDFVDLKKLDMSHVEVTAISKVYYCTLEDYVHFFCR